MYEKAIALLLFLAGLILLARQIYRRLRGKSAGCSCSNSHDREDT